MIAVYYMSQKPVNLSYVHFVARPQGNAQGKIQKGNRGDHGSLDETE